jgi:S-ribosylhomocysteine lyase LuxS involved in autoinducer biosynthesis
VPHLNLRGKIKEDNFMLRIESVMTAPSQSNIPEELLRALVKDAADVLADGEVTFGEVVRLGGSLAGKANQFVKLSGHQKQQLVVKAVEVALEQILALKNSTLPEAEREAFQQKIKTAASFAKETLPAVLDVAIQAARGQLNLMKPEVRKTLWITIVSALRCCGVQPPVLPTPVAQLLEAPKAQVELVPTRPQEPATDSKEPQNEQVPAVEERPASKASE